jgi:hypothetical protein
LVLKSAGADHWRSDMRLNRDRMCPPASALIDCPVRNFNCGAHASDCPDDVDSPAGWLGPGGGPHGRARAYAATHTANPCIRAAYALVTCPGVRRPRALHGDTPCARRSARRRTEHVLSPSLPRRSRAADFPHRLPVSRRNSRRGGVPGGAAATRRYRAATASRLPGSAKFGRAGPGPGFATTLGSDCAWPRRPLRLRG